MSTEKKYIYHYPENIEIGKKINSGDRHLIAKMLGVSKDYVNQVFRGVRRSASIIEAANKIIIANSVKEDILKK